MKTITAEDFMEIPFRMEIEKDEDEGGYIVFCEELPGCLSCGDTIAEAAVNFTDAKRAWYEVAVEEGIEWVDAAFSRLQS